MKSRFRLERPQQGSRLCILNPLSLRTLLCRLTSYIRGGHSRAKLFTSCVPRRCARRAHKQRKEHALLTHKLGKGRPPPPPPALLGYSHLLLLLYRPRISRTAFRVSSFLAALGSNTYLQGPEGRVGEWQGALWQRLQLHPPLTNQLASGTKRAHSRPRAPPCCTTASPPARHPLT